MVSYTTYASTPYKQLCQKGSNPGSLKNARGLCIEPVSGSIYIAERGNSRIQVFSSEGVHLFFIYPKCGSVDLWGICIDDGIVYVSDYHGGRLFLFTLDGETISVFGKGFDANRKLVKMIQPMGIAVNKDGDIYVCEFGANNMLILSNSRMNNHINSFKHSEPCSIVFREETNKTLIGCGSNFWFGRRPFAFEQGRMSIHKPYTYSPSLCWFGTIDCEDNLILCDVRAHKILIFKTTSRQPQLAEMKRMTFIGTPMGVAVDSQGRLVCVTSSKLCFFES